MDQHRVYLAVPGTQFCWGTTTGVIHSTAKHVAIPFNGGLGFSGVMDFNIVWTDAHNLFEDGRITHFAMLHGDIAPSTEQYWLDILLDVMREKDAELVSAHSPIKDGRGLTSCGICDPANPWGAFRRFTQREVLEDLPDVFNNELAGYPDKPLLHNTGMWVADLRKPVFRDTNADGTLRFVFRFPERIKRGEDGKWQHEQESEDWLFSRELWERGARNTWITSRVKFEHFGRVSFPNWQPFGQFKHGDEHTAKRWRKHQMDLPLSLTQILEFELGTGCNLAGEHAACPNRDARRFASLDESRELDDETIVRCAVRAYRELGFTGLIGWIYYNEPLLQADRMFRLMERIKAETPAARFILWTNGTLIPQDCGRYAAFEQIVISNYGDESQRGAGRLLAKGITAKLCGGELDGRLEWIAPTDPQAACLRPFVEFVIDARGNVHLCCYDWQGKACVGNVLTDDLAAVANRWRETLPSIAGRTMTDDAPEFCRQCGHRWSAIQEHDPSIVERCQAWRAALQESATSPPALEVAYADGQYEING